MKGDLDRCLQAGMNDFVSKPIDRAQLFGTIGKWLPKPEPGVEKPSVVPIAVPPPPAVTAPPPPLPKAADGVPDLPGLDCREPMKRLGFSWASFKNMLGAFAEDLPSDVRNLRATLDAQDWPTAFRHAHTIKGAAATYGAVELSVKAGVLEKALRELSGEYETLYAETQKEADRVLKSLQEIL